MRAPPPVEYRSAPARWWRGVLSLLVGTTLASTVAWLLPHFAAHWGSLHPDPVVDALAEPLVQAGVALGLGAAVCVVCWLSWKSGPASERMLRWDGQDWVLVGDPSGRPDQRGDASLMLDLGPWMLVRFLPYAGLGSATWLPLSIGLDMARWAALRGALWNWRAGRGDARP